MKDLNLVENDGACIQALKETLKSLNVERQAYHSLSFVGNHCHKLLQVEITFRQIVHYFYKCFSLLIKELFIKYV